MKSLLVSFVSGIVFALGLGISGMTRPIKVIGFLDFTGKWDASLAFVLISAKFLIPDRKDIDRNLIFGAALFGAGWGLAGFCPGPAVTSLASGAAPVALFVIAMVAGIYLHSVSTRMADIGIPPVRTAAQTAADS